MAITVPYVGDQNLLTKSLTAGNLSLRLYTAYTGATGPSKSIVYSNLSECAATGYAAQTLVGATGSSGATWAMATGASGASGTYNTAQTFNLQSACTVVGCYVTDLSNNLLWFEPFSDGPYTIPSNGAVVSVTVVFGLN